MTVPIMLLAASFLFPGQKQAQAQDRSFVPLTLAAATDLHYIAPELTEHPSIPFYKISSISIILGIAHFSKEMYTLLCKHLHFNVLY